jgi:hypothetical protein
MVVALMPDGDSFRFFSREQVDKILYEGAKRGRSGSHAAIERILKFEPGVERAALWQRIRRLKHPLGQMAVGRAAWNPEDDQLLRTGYERGWSGKRDAVAELLRRHPNWQPHIIWKRAATLGIVQKRLRRGQERSQQSWSEADDRILLNLSGYKDVRVIGKKLHRSANAVRSRLSVLGKSSRVHKEGYAPRTLAEELHLGSRTVRHLIVGGLLEVRDPRITRESLKGLSKLEIAPISEGQCAQEGPVLDESLGLSHHSLEVQVISVPNMPDVAPRSAKFSRAKRVWMEVAKARSLSLQTVEGYIVQGVLKLYDPRITERSVKGFCRRYGSLVNYDFLNRETRSWLESSMDFVPSGGEALARRLEARRKHARVVRKCPGCGREVRGNAFFRHIKTCRQAKSRVHGMGSETEEATRSGTEKDRSVL